MIKKRLLPLLMVAALALTGCGSKEEAPVAEGKTVNYKAEANEKGDVVTVDVKVDGEGNPVEVNIDTETKDGKKSELSAEGKYDMKNDGKKWHEQIDALEVFLKENNFDTKKVTLTNEEGNTDAVSGVSIKVGSYLEAVDAAIAEAKK